jgi:hypothetical protein
MVRLIGGQGLVLQAISDLPKDPAGYVGDRQITEKTRMALGDVRDRLETLARYGYVEVARTEANLTASVTAEGRQVSRQFKPSETSHLEKAILEVSKDASGCVTDGQIAKVTRIALKDVKDWIEMLDLKGLVKVARTTAGMAAWIAARGRLQLGLHGPPPMSYKALAAAAYAASAQTAILELSSVEPTEAVESSSIPSVSSGNSSPPISPFGEAKTALSETEVADGYQVVLLIHGIRTEADWGPMVRSKLETPGKIDVIPIRYGYFDALRFWFPFWTRNRPIERVYTQIRVALQKSRRDHPSAKLTIIAHSFGTYIIGQILKQGFELKIYRLILCGSVLPLEFEWHQYQGRFDDDAVINECGKSDIWPVLAQSASWGYGASGTHGFGAVLVKDRFHAGGHGQYFEPEFVERYWEPFIRRGSYQGTEFETKMPPTPWWLSVLGITPLKWILTLCLATALSFVAWSLVRPRLYYWAPTPERRDPKIVADYARLKEESEKNARAGIELGARLSEIDRARAELEEKLGERDRRLLKILLGVQKTQGQAEEMARSDPEIGRLSENLRALLNDFGATYDPKQLSEVDELRIVLAKDTLEGDAKNPDVKALNRLKNRYILPQEGDIDHDITLSRLLATGDDRGRFDQQKAARITGDVVRVDGGGVTSANLHSRHPLGRDTFIFMALTKDAPPTQQVPLIVSPRVRAQMKIRGFDWTTESLRMQLLGKRVEVTGWLLFSEHIHEAENTNPGGRRNWRATSWEIHPVTEIQVLSEPGRGTRR